MKIQSLRSQWFLLLALGLAVSAHAANQPPRYRYGETWWEEYESDKDTRLLLHFGPATPTAHKQLSASVRREKAEDSSLSISEVPEETGRGPRTAGASEMPAEGPSLKQLPPVDEKNVPPGMLLDYSDARRNVELRAGLKIVPDGRFGSGLACDGTGALVCRAGPVASIEGWFKVDALPAQEACLWSVARDESRLLLRPDGRLELRLAKPHGIPSAKHVTPEALRIVLAQKAEIVSPDPVRPNEWFHVVVYSKSHPCPGGGEPWDARLKVNGFDVAWQLSERFNTYSFLGTGEVEIVLGNSAAGGQGFKGLLDEVRVSSAERGYYERPALPWRDAQLARPLQFNRPFFRNDSTVFHASLDNGLKLDLDTAGAGEIAVPVAAEKLDSLCVPGIRGKGWVMDPEIGFARVPLKGLNTSDGALEFWLRPVNWDDMTGYWHHTPPLQKDLTVARAYGKDKRDGTLKPFLKLLLPRAFNLERQRVPVDPGHWLHLAAVWTSKDPAHAQLYINGQPGGQAWRANAAESAALEPAYVEFGVSEKVWATRREAPRIEIDEIVGYRAPLAEDEVAQALQRWMGKLEAIKLYNDQFSFKWSLQKLEFSLTPLLPEGQSAATCTVALHDLNQNGKLVCGPVESKTLDGGRFSLLLSEEKQLAYGRYQFRFQAKDAAGQACISGTRDWNYEEEPWRNYQGGILDKVPPPWTPIKFDGEKLETRMTRYTLGGNGLPLEIYADGVNILAGPVQFLEDGKPLAGTGADLQGVYETKAFSGADFTGQSCDVHTSWTAEYDGMVRYKLNLTPKGRLARLSCVIPLKAEYATRYLCYPVGARGVSTGVVGKEDGVVLSSRTDPASWQTWQEYQAERKKDPKLSWEQFWAPRRAKTAAYGFYTHVDLNDMNRGLWWFCDNAAGWQQSKTTGAIEVVRSGAVVSLVLNLVAEPGEYQLGAPASRRPIVFAILPHPARPFPEKYRLFNRVAPEQDARACDIYDAFFPWAQNPKAGDMCVFPAADPAKPQEGPSWAYAESCVPLMKASRARGCRTMYLSKAWFSCRAGAYDNWEWRCPESSECALTPSFVNYLCWEMNEWLKRDIWDAVYLDECYEHPTRNVEAGQAVRLPDGSIQPGVTNFQFRELMKRWRNLFTANGKDPLLIAHLTYSFQYPGVVFCDSYLDGENRPIVSLRGNDWIDSTSQTQFEVVQNGRLWGVSSFYMPFVAEGGFEDKARSQYPRWQWRMARQAQSQFAHYETATVYEGQGAQVYKQYWKDVLGWGGGDPKATFHPYWDNAAYLECEDQGGASVAQSSGLRPLVSFYRQPGKILLIASNRGKQDRVLKIKLNLQGLGLRAQPAAQSLDGSFSPPPGADFSAAELSPKAREKLLAESSTKANETLAGEKKHDQLEELAKEDLALEDPAVTKARQAGELEPKLQGAVLLVPVRARDFRVVKIE
ncbi:MAG: LamG-like jellyroll fold domain-containing protein [Planctomycetota bacterium]